MSLKKKSEVSSQSEKDRSEAKGALTPETFGSIDPAEARWSEPDDRRRDPSFTPCLILDQDTDADFTFAGLGLSGNR